MSAEDHRCLACDGSPLHEAAQYRAMPRVTSDCRPWPAGGRMTWCGTCGTIQKIPDRGWLDDIAAIYGSYVIYAQSGGAEPLISLGDGAAVARSRAVAGHLGRHLPARNAPGRLIDIGCGNGAALGSFSQALPGWSLSGVELSDRHIERLSAIPGFESLFREIPEAGQDGRFDVVSMIHSLEHMRSPRRTLAAALRLLRPDGTLLIQIPNVETSPFDLLVADHLAHFSPATLTFLARRVGIGGIELSTAVLPKEMSLIGHHPAGNRDGNADAAPCPDPGQGGRIVGRTLDWLAEVLAVAARIDGPFGVFGSSISAAWLDGVFGRRIAFFVDEDPTHTGRAIGGRPILSPAQVPPGATIYVPLIPAIAERVIARLSPLPLRLVAPPPFTP